jgi:hypothetical protein
VPKPPKMGSVYQVSNADVICANWTASATVYTVSKVLVSMH